MALSLHYCAFFFKFIFELGGQRRNSERDDSNVWVVVGYACVRVTEQKGGGVGSAYLYYLVVVEVARIFKKKMFTALFPSGRISGTYHTKASSLRLNATARFGGGC